MVQKPPFAVGTSRVVRQVYCFFHGYLETDWKEICALYWAYLRQSNKKLHLYWKRKKKNCHFHLVVAVASQADKERNWALALFGTNWWMMLNLTFNLLTLIYAVYRLLAFLDFIDIVYPTEKNIKNKYTKCIKWGKISYSILTLFISWLSHHQN